MLLARRCIKNSKAALLRIFSRTGLCESDLDIAKGPPESVRSILHSMLAPDIFHVFPWLYWRECIFFFVFFLLCCTLHVCCCSGHSLQLQEANFALAPFSFRFVSFSTCWVGSSARLVNGEGVEEHIKYIFLNCRIKSADSKFFILFLFFIKLNETWGNRNKLWTCDWLFSLPLTTLNSLHSLLDYIRRVFVPRQRLQHFFFAVLIFWKGFCRMCNGFISCTGAIKFVIWATSVLHSPHRPSMRHPRWQQTAHDRQQWQQQHSWDFSVCSIFNFSSTISFLCVASVLFPLLFIGQWAMGRGRGVAQGVARRKRVAHKENAGKWQRCLQLVINSFECEWSFFSAGRGGGQCTVWGQLLLHATWFERRAVNSQIAQMAAALRNCHSQREPILNYVWA